MPSVIRPSFRPDLPGPARVLRALGTGILDTEPSYIQDIGLARHLSPTRSNGVAAMLAFIRETAQAQLQRDPS